MSMHAITRTIRDCPKTRERRVSQVRPFQLRAIAGIGVFNPIEASPRDCRPQEPIRSPDSNALLPFWQQRRRFARQISGVRRATAAADYDALGPRPALHMLAAARAYLRARRGRLTWRQQQFQPVGTEMGLVLGGSALGGPVDHHLHGGMDLRGPGGLLADPLVGTSLVKHGTLVGGVKELRATNSIDGAPTKSGDTVD